MQIEELNGANSNAILKKRVWSPALQGLGSEKYLSETQGGTTYYALGDANKNVTEYLDASGNIKAHYEFSPFGKVVTATGTMSGDFNYRFSSEHLDIETGLVYYIRRYYSPEIGRWISKDPIGERGGKNLYGIVNNHPINSYDRLGLVDCCGKTPYNKNTQCCCAKDTLIEKGELKFDGFCTYLQVGEFFAGMQMMCALKSTITESCTYYDFLLHITFAGFTAGLPFGDGAFPVSFSGADTPSDFNGWATYFAGTASMGAGVSYSKLLIGGNVTSDLPLLPSWVAGIDFGADAMTGYAWTTSENERSCK